MKIRNTALLTAITAFTAFFCFSGATLWEDRNNYRADAWLRQGSVIVVKVSDISSFKYKLVSKTAGSSSIEVSPDTSVTGFLPKVQSSDKIKNDETGDFSGGSGTSFTIAASVTGRTAEGRLSISGTKNISFNGTANSVALTGTVDPSLLRGRSINSSEIADLRILIDSRRTAAKLEFNEKKEGENTSAGLTDEQKDRLLMDFINRFISEQERMR